MKTPMAHKIILGLTLDLQNWLEMASEAGVEAVPADPCPTSLPIGNPEAWDELATSLDLWWEKIRSNASEQLIWRWNLCAPTALKAASRLQLPVRIPLPSQCLHENRLMAIMEDARQGGITRLYPLARPWQQRVTGEWRVLVGPDGSTLASPKLGLGNPSLEREARHLAATIHTKLRVPVACSLDFLELEGSRLLFLEGGPPVSLGADPYLISEEEALALEQSRLRPQR